MKTTIEIADDLARLAKAHAARENITLRALVERGLRLALRADGERGPLRAQGCERGRPGLAAPLARGRLGTHSRVRLRRPWKLIAADTNILVYAHRVDSEWHEQAKARIESLAQGRVS